MKPILFPSTATQFNTNGLGRLDAISCTVTEERNGMFELEMEIAETSEHAKQIEVESIIVAKPNQTDSNQAFRVYQMTKPIDGRFTVLARHITYQLSYITAMPFEIAMSASACANTLAGLKSNAVGTCPFDFSTDVVTGSSYKQTTPASIRSRLGGVQGSVLDQFGGEYKWDNWNVYLYSHRGVQTPQVTLRYGKNIIDFEQEKNIENTITGIVPYWADSEGGELVTLTEKVVETTTASSYPFKKTIPYDFSSDFEEKPTEAQLRARAQAYLNTNNVGVPKVSIKLSFVNLSDTEEFKDIAALQTVSLCDMVNVQFEKLGISTTAEVIKTDYDVLKERYNSIEIGSLRSTLASTISGAMQEIGDIHTTTQEMIKTNNTTLEGYADNAAKDYFNNHITAYPTSQQMQTAINTATTWLTSADGYVIAVKDPDTGAWKELLFADHDDPEQWHNVLRINENGIGFSSNGGQTYTQAWTIDGRIVIGGTNVPSLTVYDSNNNVIFQTTAEGTIWNSTNSSMDQDGTITVKNMIVNKGYLKLINPNYESYHDPDPEHVYVYDGKYPDPSIQYLLQIGNYTQNNYDSAGLEITTNKIIINQDGEIITKDNTPYGTQTKSVLIDGHIKGYSNNKSQNPPNSTLYSIFDAYPKKDANGDGLQIDGNIRVNGSLFVPNSNGWAQGDSESIRLYDVDGNAYKLTFNRGICTYCGLDL